jgi:Transcriptional regulator containing PAS, AAA-type ATPase, and DNA-binding domains
VTVGDVRKRCLIWLGQPSRREREVLAAAGWGLRVVEAPTRTHIGLRGTDLVVALLDLRRASPAWTGEAMRLLERYPELPWAFLGEAPETLPRVRAHLRLREPLDLAQMRSLQTLAEGAAVPEDDDSLVGTSPCMLRIRANLNKFAPVDLPVLITGETGTGKELAARALHRMSRRRDGPFIAVNCGALPPYLVQSELFGHEKGAFTGATARRIGMFEAAHGGTIFLDEVGDLPLDAQTNLLRVLQEGTLERIGSHQQIRVDVRVLAATHVNLEQAVAQGRFREDLFYRLDVLRLHMPPLRDRGDDIELLAAHFLEAFRKEHPTRARGFTPEARRAMRLHGWPGNVRELANRVRRAAVVCDTELIPVQALQLDAPDEAQPDGHAICPRQRAERNTLLEALHQSGYNVSECARRLRVSRVTVYRLCRKHQLRLESLRS